VFCAKGSEQVLKVLKKGEITCFMVFNEHVSCLVENGLGRGKRQSDGIS
jgi:hypothetical protein